MKNLRSPTGVEWIGRVLLVVAGIVFLILDDVLPGIIAIVVGLALLVIPFLGSGGTRA